MLRRTSPACSRLVDRAGACEDPLPLLVAVGPVTRGVSRSRSTCMLSREVDLRFAPCVPVMGAALVGVGVRSQRDMAFAGQQARGRIEPDPAGARDVDLGPGVQVGEVLACAVRSSASGRSWIEIAGHEARSEAEAAQDLHQQPAGIAARSPTRLASVSSGVCTPGSMRTR